MVMGKVLMVQGTASNAGKSILVTALCRIFRQDGFSVAPFKSQNMSLNSFVTPDGGEIGRAQAVQAEACEIAPTVDMNPILLKPEAQSRSQIVLRGKPRSSTAAVDYYRLRSELWPVVTESLDKLRSQYDIVVIEGAGSPAEVNLAKDEIVNMRVARYCNAPVLLVGDIDRGGVFASLLGTLWLLPEDDRKLVKAMVINKFRGDVKLLEPGIIFLEEKAGIPVAGVIPHFNNIFIAQEDSVGLERPLPQPQHFQVDIAVIRLPHISNFDDFDPLVRENGVRVRYVSALEELGKPDLIIIPGSKTTSEDLAWLRQSGLASRIIESHRNGAYIIGICGGYQMLGEFIDDPDSVESDVRRQPGLNMLPVITAFLPTKETHQVKGEVASQRGILSQAAGTFDGYEIHMGRTEISTDASAFHITKRSQADCRLPDGCLDESGRVLGTYIHGLFRSKTLRRGILKQIAESCGRSLEMTDEHVPDEYDKLADHVRRHINMEFIYDITGLK